MPSLSLAERFASAKKPVYELLALGLLRTCLCVYQPGSFFGIKRNNHQGEELLCTVLQQYHEDTEKINT